MSTELPLYHQEKSKTCALACLRMVLAAHGTTVTEWELESQARMEPRGTPIDELERLVRKFGLDASIQEATVAELRAILATGKFPIAYINRMVFELRSLLHEQDALRNYRFHCVIPVRITDAFVTFHDPLPPAITRRSVARFACAQSHCNFLCVVCEGPESSRPGKPAPETGL